MPQGEVIRMTQAETPKTFEARIAEYMKMMTRVLTPERRERLRWDERIHLVRGFIVRRLAMEDAAAASEASVHLDAGMHHPHPLLVSLVRVLARAAAEADLTAQRNHDQQGDPV